MLSVHETRQLGETALEDRKRRLGKSVQDGDTRIAWFERSVQPDAVVTAGALEMWHPGEAIPYRETHRDND